MDDKTIIATVHISPSESNGYATLVRSIDDPKDVWWKWYGTQNDALAEAEMMGLVAVKSVLGNGLTATLRWGIENPCKVKTSELKACGFGIPPSYI